MYRSLQVQFYLLKWGKGEIIVYMTITDWQTEMPATPEQFAADVGIAFENFKEVGATNLRIFSPFGPCGPCVNALEKF